jgi:hypothetical protein
MHKTPYFTGRATECPAGCFVAPALLGGEEEEHKPEARAKAPSLALQALHIPKHFAVA